MKFSRMTLAATALAGFAGSALAQQPVQTTAPAPAATAPQPATAPAQANPAPATAAPAAAPATPPRAVATDLRVGAQVLGADGQPVGTIETADASGAIVTTGTKHGRLALDAFYRGEQGLVIGYSRADFERLASPVGPATSDGAAPQN